MITVVTIEETATATVATASPASVFCSTSAISRAFRAQGSFRLEMFPVMKVMYSAQNGKAWKEECGVRKQIQVRDARPPLVVISRSHSNDPELQEYLEQLGEHQTTSIGSSLKFCLVAEGQAQLYPRFGPTSTWDTAAGHAVAVAAGAHVHDWQGKTLDYTPRESFLNPGFRVSIY